MDKHVKYLYTQILKRKFQFRNNSYDDKIYIIQRDVYVNHHNGEDEDLRQFDLMVDEKFYECKFEYCYNCIIWRRIREQK